jgi:hypothetical protein
VLVCIGCVLIGIGLSLGGSRRRCAMVALGTREPPGAEWPTANGAGRGIGSVEEPRRGDDPRPRGIERERSRTR